MSEELIMHSCIFIMTHSFYLPSFPSFRKVLKTLKRTALFKILSMSVLLILKLIIDGVLNRLSKLLIIPPCNKYIFILMELHFYYYVYKVMRPF